jgi:dGTPase
MEWIKLLSEKRLGVGEKSADRVDGRSEFQKDFDRIVFSPAFRRLQDKTQVFPLPESDFVHTRLTHSLEVSVVGRSLGNLVGKVIIERNPVLSKNCTQFHFGEIVAAACLAHDIGNPPFGHSGEDAIAEYFKSGNGKSFELEINDEKKWNDLTRFEGNAQGFRIVTKLQNPNVPGALQLTFGTLATLSKYPRESFTTKTGEEKLKDLPFKKFGFFQSEKKVFKEVAERVGLEKAGIEYCWSRHPLAFLVEAADDICYRIMDLEDGYRLGLISFDETEELLRPLIDSEFAMDYKHKEEKDRIGYLRAKSISNLVRLLAESFVENENKILEGKFSDELISVILKEKYLTEIMNVSIKKIYRSKGIVEREVAGYEVLGGLLDTFIHAYNEKHSGKLSPKNRAVVNLLPQRVTSEINADIYERLLRVIDFISGMTDSSAVSLFRKIKGISLPSSRIVD